MSNIVFAKDNKTRHVKHGFSWQVGLFGPLTYVMRAQYLLALACLASFYVIYLVAGGLSIVLLDVPVAVAQVLGYAAVFAVGGIYGNRFSARSYVKNGWKPVDSFPSDWNKPPLPQLNPTL